MQPRLRLDLLERNHVARQGANNHNQLGRRTSAGSAARGPSRPLRAARNLLRAVEKYAADAFPRGNTRPRAAVRDRSAYGEPRPTKRIGLQSIPARRRGGAKTTRS